MNDAVMSQCQSLVIQLSSASFMLWPVGCVRVSVSPFMGMSDRYTGIRALGVHSRRPSAFPLEYKERKWWDSPWRRWERAKQRKERKDTSWPLHQKLFLLLLMAICGLLPITKQLTWIHRDRASGLITELWQWTVRISDAAGSNLAHKLCPDLTTARRISPTHKKGKVIWLSCFW